MAFLLHKFQEAVKVLAKSPKFSRDPRHLQFEADVNRLFLYTSFNRLGECADEKDADEIIEMANKASVTDQQKQVQENIHFQAKNICESMDEILCPDRTDISDLASSKPSPPNPPRRSGLGFAVGRATPTINNPVIPKTNPLTRHELSAQLKDKLGYTTAIKPSRIPHKEAGNGLFLSGRAREGSIVAFYPGIIYSPAHYRHIPGYPKINSSNSYLITRYDGAIINAQPWGCGGESRGIWDGSYQPHGDSTISNEAENINDKLWSALSKPLDSGVKFCEVIERRNPLAFGHFANHPGEGVEPNVMVCPYDYPLREGGMRVYVPNLVFGSEEGVNMKRFGSFWFRSGRVENGDDGGPTVRALVLVATRGIEDEEVFLNYRLSNSKRRPSWYFPVDEEEDRRRWG